MTADILGLGEPLIEMVRLPAPIDGRPAYVQGFGGDTSTAIIAASRQGAKAGYISAVGDDAFGGGLRDLWTREGVDHTHVLTRENSSTGVCFIDPDPEGRNFTYLRKVSAATTYSSQDLPETAIANSRALHLSGITLAISVLMRAAAFEAMRLAKNHDTLVSLDLNHRPKLWSDAEARPVIETALGRADIVFASDDEARLLFGDETPEAIVDRFLGMGASIVVAKHGAKGALIGTPEGRHHIPPAPSNPIDSSGAGDAFAGSFLSWFLETGDPLIAATKAAEVAAATVSGLGAVEPIPRR